MDKLPSEIIPAKYRQILYMALFLVNAFVIGADYHHRIFDGIREVAATLGLALAGYHAQAKSTPPEFLPSNKPENKKE